MRESLAPLRLVCRFPSILLPYFAPSERRKFPLGSVGKIRPLCFYLNVICLFPYMKYDGHTRCQQRHNGATANIFFQIKHLLHDFYLYHLL